jgi:hypothetical protein
MTIVILILILSARQICALGKDQCSDDGCIAVASVTSDRDGTIQEYEVAHRLSSRAKRVSQRERFVVTYLLDETGRRYDPKSRQGQPPFDTLLGAGEAITTARTFRVPLDTRGLGLVITREGDFGFPRCCIIGKGPFYKAPIVYLPT